MPRKSDKLEMKWFEDQVVKVFRVTTYEERKKIATDWCMSFALPKALSEKWDLTPMALLVASMIDIEHPLLVSERGVIYGLLHCSIVLLRTHLRGVAVPLPITCTQGAVYRLCTSVDNPPVVHRPAEVFELVHS
jgi:hypothetical protein